MTRDSIAIQAEAARLVTFDYAHQYVMQCLHQLRSGREVKVINVIHARAYSNMSPVERFRCTREGLLEMRGAMAVAKWSADDSAWIVENETLDDIELAAWRDGWIDDWEQELIDLAEAKIEADDEDVPIGGGIAFGLAFGVAIASMVVNAYVAGRGGNAAMTDDDWSKTSAMLVKQDEFATNFVDEIKAGSISKTAAKARAGMYSGATAAAFEQGKAAQRNFIPPMLPGVDCKGLTRCRCYWRIETFADRIEGTWIAKGDAETCNPCASHAIEWAPLVQER